MGIREASDEWLMRRAAEGSAPALEELMARYHRPLYSFMVHQGAPDPEDCCQETWLRIARAAASYDPPRRFATWMFAIALNVCRDAWRAAAARPATAPIEAAADVPAGGQSPEQQAVSAALAELPRADRELLALRYFQGLTESETAQVLAIPAGTVKSRTHQAMQRLKKLVTF